MDNPSPPPDRREFMTGLAAGILGGASVVAPVFAGIMVALDPLRRPSTQASLVYVTNLQALPADGVPRKFNIVADRIDAWNTYKNVPIGAVYLRRTGDGPVEALSTTCPHAGCFVNYQSGNKQFLCPCHDSAFALDGTIKTPSSPSPRAMDVLEVEIRDTNEVWVRFQNFQPGHKEKIPVA